VRSGRFAARRMHVGRARRADGRPTGATRTATARRRAGGSEECPRRVRHCGPARRCPRNPSGRRPTASSVSDRRPDDGPAGAADAGRCAVRRAACNVRRRAQQPHFAAVSRASDWRRRSGIPAAPRRATCGVRRGGARGNRTSLATQSRSTAIGSVRDAWRAGR
jgi:hypothetical protein